MGLGIHFRLITEVIIVVVIKGMITIWISIIRGITTGTSSVVPIRLLWCIRKIIRQSGRRWREFKGWRAKKGSLFGYGS